MRRPTTRRKERRRRGKRRGKRRKRRKRRRRRRRVCPRWNLSVWTVQAALAMMPK
jgi:hypothetical protein